MSRPTKTYHQPSHRILNLLLVASLTVACTQATSNKSDLSGHPAEGSGAASLTVSSSGSVASQLPLTASAASPANLTEQTKPGSNTDTKASPIETKPAASVGQAANVTSNENTQSVLPTVTPDQPIIEGDPNRFQYAFFVKTPAYLSFNDFAEGTQLNVIFTQDANFCDRKAAPLHVQELLAYQYIYPEGQANPYIKEVFNISTWPDYKGWFGPFLSDNDVSKFDDPNFVWSNCTLTNTERGGRSFPQAAWTLTTATEETIDTATSITVTFHARNKVQEVAWSFVAKKCDALESYIDTDHGHHPKPVAVPCSKSAVLKED